MSGNKPDIDAIGRLLEVSVRVQMQMLKRVQKISANRAESITANKVDVIEYDRITNYVNALNNAFDLFKGNRLETYQDDLKAITAKLWDAEERIVILERMRPMWAQGYSNDSVAAQVTAATLTQIWDMLGVKNQTEAVAKLEQLLNPACVSDQNDEKKLKEHNFFC